jgi:hypothetical protein
MNKKRIKNTLSSIKFNTGWCFALLNGRLAEIYFDQKSGVHSHCYVQREEFSKNEQKMIETDIKKHQFTYRKKVYRDKLLNSTSRKS